MPYLKSIMFFLLLFFTIIIQANADFTGKVVKVVDGDTIDVLTQHKQKIRVRLIDIDAPESGQAYGNLAKQYLAKLIAGKIVLVKENQKDMYHRTLGTIFYNNRNINAKMVAAGYAWAYRYKGVVNNKEMEKLEHIAKQNKMGLWKDKNPQAPWNYRRQHRR